MARLDRLVAVKEIAQIGAGIAREFSYALLHAVVGSDEASLRSCRSAARASRRSPAFSEKIAPPAARAPLTFQISYWSLERPSEFRLYRVFDLAVGTSAWIFATCSAPRRISRLLRK